MFKDTHIIPSTNALVAESHTPAVVPLVNAQSSSTNLEHEHASQSTQSTLEQPIELTDTSISPSPTKQEREANLRHSDQVKPTSSRLENPSDPASHPEENSVSSSHVSASHQPAVQEVIAPTLDDSRARDLANQLQGIELSSNASSAPLSEPSQHPRPNPPPIPRRNDTELEEQWPLKQIAWPPLPPPPSDHSSGIVTHNTYIKIICQNRNGPCSLIALCNILILRHDIIITPGSRDTVSYSFLAQLLADYLLQNNTDPLQLESVLELLPGTRYGLTLNPCFAYIDGFRQSDNGQGELALFRLSKVPLLHGWVPDPQDHEIWDAVVTSAGDYDQTTELLVEAAELGAVVTRDMSEDDVIKAIQKQSQWTPEQEQTARRGQALHRFLDASPTQLTYHGLFLLSSMVAPSSLSALFRNSHLSVLYRRPATPGTTSEPQLFTLVTDSTFSSEPDVCWESLEDVEGSNADFYDGALRRTSVRGGDWVRSAGARKRDHDAELAQQLQNEEYEHRSRQDSAQVTPGRPAKPPVHMSQPIATSPDTKKGKSRIKSKGKDSKDKEKCLMM